MPKPSRKLRVVKLLRAKASKVTFDKKNLQTILGLVFVILGILFLYKIPIAKIPSTEVLSQPTPFQKAVSIKEPISASPNFQKNQQTSDVVRILISKESIDLPVTPSKIMNGYWVTSKSTASHGEGSANPGTGGNIVIFAHARVGLFYNLKDVKKDDTIYVFTKDKWYRYEVGEIKTVYPKDITVVAPTKSEVLTLFTCSGFFDEKRLIVKALPIN